MIPIQPYNVDRSVSPRDYSHLEKDQLLVHGEFYTIQGEGPWAGHPAYFVRLAGCNYGDKTRHCRMCDTTFDFDKGVVTDVRKIVERASTSGAELIVVTGGEPFLQHQGLMSLAIAAAHDSVPFTVQVESNGVYIKEMTKLLDMRLNMVVVVSPKPDYLTGYSATLIKKLFSMAYLDRPESGDFYFKFLVGEEPPYNVVPFVEELSLLPRGTVFLSPVTVYRGSPKGEVADAWNPQLVDQEKTAANHRLAAALCMKHGFRLSMQMHNFCQIA